MATTLAQVSDIHVCPEGTLYQGVADSNAMFAQAIQTLNHLQPAPDLVLITGDLTEDGTPAEYRMLRQLLAALELPYRVMPGNHDNRRHLCEAFPEHTYLPAEGALHFAMDIGEVRLLALDSTVPELHHGELDRAALIWLDGELTACRGRRAVVAMHHPPFATGIPYLDIYGLRNAQAFEQVLSAHDHVDRVIAGHVHRLMHTQFGGVPVITCPSTVTQIALRTAGDAEPASFLEPPALLQHVWAGGRCAVSHLTYIGQYAGPFPFA